MRSFPRGVALLVLPAMLLVTGCSAQPIEIVGPINDQPTQLPATPVVSAPSVSAAAATAVPTVTPSAASPQLPTPIPTAQPFSEIASPPADTLRSSLFGLEVTTNRDGIEFGEPEIIRGVIDPRSGGGHRNLKHDFWVESVRLLAWRDATGELVESELSLSRPLGPEVEGGFSDMRRYELYEFLVQRREDGPYGVVLEIRQSGIDPELASVAETHEEFWNTPVIEETSLGQLTLNRHVNVYYGDAQWESKTVTLALNAVDDTIEQEGLRAAEDLWSEQAAWTEMVEAFAVQELLPLKNCCWLDDGQEPLTEQEFRSRMTLGTIDVGPDGSFSFWHDDGDLFFGHSIAVYGTLEDGPTDADIPG